jgi:hypothetical protein
MQSLLSSARRPENRPGAALADRQRDGKLSIRVHSQHESMLSDIRQELGRNGIRADEGEILQALCDAMANRPAIYRGLIAAWLLTP